MSKNEALGIRIRAARKAQGLTQEELSVKLDRHSETISRIERGLMAPSLELAIQIAESLDASLDKLVGRDSNTSNLRLSFLAEIDALLTQLDDKTLTIALQQIRALVDNA